MTAAIKGRPAHETLESLRLTLLKVEQSVEPGQDAEALAELKRILLQRIAELEATAVIESAEVQIPDESESSKSDLAALVPPATMTAADSQDISPDVNLATPPVKPD